MRVEIRQYFIQKKVIFVNPLDSTVEQCMVFIAYFIADWKLNNLWVYLNESITDVIK